jgi:hypothetical protein
MPLTKVMFIFLICNTPNHFQCLKATQNELKPKPTSSGKMHFVHISQCMERENTYN